MTFIFNEQTENDQARVIYAILLIQNRPLSANIGFSFSSFYMIELQHNRIGGAKSA